MTLFSTHWLSMILLSLNNVTPEHLWVLYFNLRVIKYIVIIIDILYNLYRLRPLPLLWFRRTSSSILLLLTLHLVSGTRWFLLP